MDAKLTAHCTVVVAAAGYGKTEAVRRWLAPVATVWQAGPGALVHEPEPTPRSGWVVLDDLAGVRPDDLRDRLSRLGDARVVLVSRWPLTTRLPVAGPVQERGPADLALGPADTAEVLRREYGLDDPAVAASVYEQTAGWPALVRLAGERLATSPPDRGESLGAPGTSVATFLDKHVLSTLPPATARFVRDCAHLGPLEEDLARALGHRRPDRTIARLTRIGLIRDRRLVPLVAEVARDRWPLPPEETPSPLRTAGDWYARADRYAEAIDAYRRAGAPEAGLDLLRRHGPAWVIAGGAPAIAATIGAVPSDRRPPELRRLHGEALLVLGEDDRALDELTLLAGASGPLDPGLAWRLGAVQYLRANPGAAAAAFARGRLAGRDTADEALLLAWDATARWMAGDTEACGDLARAAAAAADRAGDDRARAAAHVAQALHAMMSGDRAGNAAHWDHALRYAETAHDVVQAARIRANRAALLLEEARYPEALVEARAAKDLARATGYAPILAVALCNEADALVRLADLDEATDRFSEALALFQRKSSHKVAYPLIGLGAIHRSRGRHSLARAAYEEAARAATATGDIQGMVPALAGLARVLADLDPDEAARQAALALAAASGPFLTEALLGAGWAHLGAGDRATAERTAVEAATQARRHRDTGGLAEALELRAAATDDVADARRWLREAEQTWSLTGAPIDLDRVRVRLGRLPEAPVAERVNAELAQARLDDIGISLPSRGHPTGPAARPNPSVRIRTLGRFEVVVDGAAVTMSMWQSRKARDLLAVLVARRGRAIARDELTELLWPGGDPGRLAHRLSVALSTVRSIVDPDRVAEADHFVHADRSGVALMLDHVTVDLEQFLAEAEHGFLTRDRGLTAEARAVLAAAERRYLGDFLENEPYEDWSVAAREEARATYLRVVRTLAQLSRAVEKVDDAVRYLLKVIDKDPYDEAGHRELVETLAAAGRYGESRRAEARYQAAMRVIGITPQ